VLNTALADPADERVTLEEPIGGGSQATVFRARRADGSVVAAKRVSAADDTAVAGLHAEALALQRCVHPHVLPYHGLAAIDDAVLLLTPLAETDLADRLAHGGPLPWPEVAAIGMAMASALAAVHAHALVHRDVKPANILWLDGVPRLADFGSATSHGVGSTQRDTDTIVGSAPYLDPRVVDGTPADPAADVYALGATLHEAVTGQAPFLAATVPATLDAARVGAWARPDIAGAHALLDVIEAAVGPFDQRPTAAAMAAQLAQATPTSRAGSDTPAEPAAWVRPQPLRPARAGLSATRDFGVRAHLPAGGLVDRHRATLALVGMAGVAVTTLAAVASLA